MAALALATLQQAACLPLDDLSSYSSAWERQSMLSDDTPLDASVDVGDRGDSGAAGADAPPDASTPLGPTPDAGDAAPAPDAGEGAALSDAGPELDAGQLDAALAP